MFKFLGIQHINFVPDGQTEPMQGYSMHFSDDTANENLIGSVPFKCFFTYVKAAEVLQIRNPMEMYRFSEHVGKPCQLAFNRKGKIDGVSFDEPVQSPAPSMPVAHDAKGGKPNKLDGDTPF